VATAVERSAEIERLAYNPVAPYLLDLEILRVASLRERIGRNRMQSTHRYAFHALVCVTEGDCRQVVDFRHVSCRPGSLLAFRPGQVHSFGPDHQWDGWIVAFRPEFISPSPVLADLTVAKALGSLPDHLSLAGDDLAIVTRAIEQMRNDTGSEAGTLEVHALLRHQLYALILRLSLLHRRQRVGQASPTGPALQRFERFRCLVEENFTRWHQVAHYAERLACSEKSLTRAAAEAAGMNAKAFIAARINLEAKRLLAHTAGSVALIGEGLGFDDPANFIKFFKREAGCTPSEFRRRQDVGRSD
jgi:AraC-like DNA-binding protein